MRLSSTSHSPSLLPSPPPPHLPPPAAAAAALRRARTPQCKDCSSITFGARQGLANFSDGYIVQLDSLLAQASPHVSNSSSVPQLNTASAPYTPTLSLFFMGCRLCQNDFPRKLTYTLLRNVFGATNPFYGDDSLITATNLRGDDMHSRRQL